jgi:hypothetical protein
MLWCGTAPFTHKWIDEFEYVYTDAYIRIHVQSDCTVGRQTVDTKTVASGALYPLLSIDGVHPPARGGRQQHQRHFTIGQYGSGDSRRIRCSQ